MLVHPFFLLRRAQPDPQNIGRSRFKEGLNILLLIFGKSTERRSVGSRHNDTVSFMERDREAFCGPAFSPIKEMTVSGSGFAAKRFHELGSVNAALKCVTMPSA